MTRTRFASDHAIARYQERVRPTLSLAACKRELMALLNSGLEPQDPPAWAPHLDEPVLELSDGILALLEGRSCVTILTRSGMSEEVRARRNHKKSTKRRARAYRSKLTRGRRPEPNEAYGL